jgi:hypothetical protein
MGGGYLTQPFYHMAPRQTMPYSTSDFGIKVQVGKRQKTWRQKKLEKRKRS